MKMENIRHYKHVLYGRNHTALKKQNYGWNYNLRHPSVLHDCDSVSAIVQIVVLPPCWASLQSLDLLCVCTSNILKTLKEMLMLFSWQISPLRHRFWCNCPKIPTRPSLHPQLNEDFILWRISIQKTKQTYDMCQCCKVVFLLQRLYRLPCSRHTWPLCNLLICSASESQIV